MHISLSLYIYIYIYIHTYRLKNKWGLTNRLQRRKDRWVPKRSSGGESPREFMVPLVAAACCKWRWGRKMSSYDMARALATAPIFRVYFRVDGKWTENCWEDIWETR